MNWADKVLKYKEKQDFSLIDKRHEIDRVALVDLLFILDKEKIKSLYSLPVKNYSSREELNSVLCQYYGEAIKR
jgi:hypothetical protein